MRQYEDSEILNHQLNSCRKRERIKPYSRLKGWLRLHRAGRRVRLPVTEMHGGRTMEIQEHLERQCRTGNILLMVPLRSEKKKKKKQPQRKITGTLSHICKGTPLQIRREWVTALAGQGEQTLALLIIAQLKGKVQELVDNREEYQTVSADRTRDENTSVQAEGKHGWELKDVEQSKKCQNDHESEMKSLGQTCKRTEALVWDKWETQRDCEEKEEGIKMLFSLQATAEAHVQQKKNESSNHIHTQSHLELQAMNSQAPKGSFLVRNKWLMRETRQKNYLCHSQPGFLLHCSLRGWWRLAPERSVGEGYS